MVPLYFEAWSILSEQCSQAVVVHVFNPSTWEAGACEEQVCRQSQDGAQDCSQVLWLAPDFLIHLKISHSHRENCAGAPWCKIGPYNEWWFWPMDCCYVDWADGAWLRGYIRDCDWGWVFVFCFCWRDWFLERDSCMMLKGSWINCFEKNVVL
jgi:hypothetical protein